jgi:hypothetical protein
VTGRDVRAPVQWWSRTSLRLHVTLVFGLALCGIASWIEWRRALGGHQLAWAYAFEWPLFAVLGTWVWWRLVHDDTPGQRGVPKRRQTRANRHIDAVDADDAGLIAWQNYLDRLHAEDPPGGPPIHG